MKAVFSLGGLKWRLDCLNPLPLSQSVPIGTCEWGFQMRTSRIFAALPVLFLLLTGAQNLYADSVTFDCSFSGTGITASGTFAATLVSGNEYLVTSISGMQNGFAMTILAPRAYSGNDNNVFSSGPFLDGSGLGFVLSNGTTDYN